MKFYRFWPNTPIPEPARADIKPHFSARAVQFCEPLTAAASLGVLLYPPINFHLLWDGESTFVRFDDSESWILVDRIFLPDFADIWQKHMPEHLHEAMPSFMDAFPERNIVQMWPGLYAETTSGTSLMVRAPINRHYPTNYRLIEGVIETDTWAGPIFTNIEWIKTDRPVHFRTDVPVAQVIPVLRQWGKIVEPEGFDIVELEDGIPNAYAVKMWDTYRRRNTEKTGSYKREVKKRAQKPREPVD